MCAQAYFHKRVCLALTLPTKFQSYPPLNENSKYFELKFYAYFLVLLLSMPFYSSPSAPSPAISGEPLFLSSRPSAHPCHSDQSISLSFRPSAHPCHFERAPSLSFRPSEARGEIRFLGFALRAPLEMTVASVLHASLEMTVISTLRAPLEMTEWTALRDKAFRLPQGGHIPRFHPTSLSLAGTPNFHPTSLSLAGTPSFRAIHLPQPELLIHLISRAYLLRAFQVASNWSYRPHHRL